MKHLYLNKSSKIHILLRQITLTTLPTMQHQVCSRCLFFVFLNSRGLCFDMAAGFETFVCYVCVIYAFTSVAPLFSCVAGKFRGF